MSNPLADAAIKSGLIPSDSLAEAKRWGAPINVPEKVPEPPKTVEEAAATMRTVLESQGFVVTRETDLQILQQYLSTQKSGMLHVEVPVEDGEFDTTQADFEVMFGKTPLGEFIFPWRGESLQEEITNGLSYLKAFTLKPEGGAFDIHKIWFKEVREVFYGDVKAFMVCLPSRMETSHA